MDLRAIAMVGSENGVVLVALALVLVTGACADSPSPPAITDPTTPWPRSLAELGSQGDGEWTPHGDRVIAYDVAYPLWSGGSDKQRHLVLPEDAGIDDGDRERWRFVPGTVAFKTFAMAGRPLETRAIRQVADGVEYAAYRWADDDAALLELDDPVTIDLGTGEVHTVPARLQCRQCHETAASAFLGMNELQLADELDSLDELGVFTSEPPQTPARIDHPDPNTVAVLGWFVGNCTHCHNGGAQDNASFDLAPAVALANTVEVPTESSATTAGIRIVPGDPLASILFLAVSGEHDDPELEDMPPVGIDRRDAAGIAALRTMIEGLAP